MLAYRSAARWLLIAGLFISVARVGSPALAADAAPATTTGTVKYEPPADEQGIPDFFRLSAHSFDFEMKPLPSSSSKIAVSEVTFPSPMTTPHPNNNTVHTEFFRPKAPGKYPGVIVLHILGGDFDLARLVARQLATNNVAALFLKLPYYGPREQPGVDVKMISADPQQTVLGFKQAVVDIRQATAWLGAQPEVDPEQLGITGISLGGITGALAFTAEPRFKKAFLMLAGGDIARIGAESPEAKEILGDWTSKGGTLEELVEIIRPIDPVTYGSNIRGRQVVMFNASHDEIVPPACTEALWKAFGEPEIKWVNAGHYTAARYILGALTRCTKLFQEAPVAAHLKKAGGRQSAKERSSKMRFSQRTLQALSALVVALLPFGIAHRAIAAEPVKTTARPNVLFIAVDDLNHWVGYLGRNPQTITPNIDRLAGRGVRFTRSYCAAPVCNPSRASLMSGLRPATTGVYSNGDDWRNVVPPERTLLTTFRQAGYYVCGAGKIYHGAFERRSEWDDYLERAKTDPKPTGDGGVGGIRFAPLDCRDEDLLDWHSVEYGIRQLRQRREEPLFLAVGLHKPHMPWNVPRKYYDMHPLDKIELPPTKPDDLADVPPAGVEMARPAGDHQAIVESGRWKEAVQGYLAAISYTDMLIGRLIEAFDKSPYRDDTIIVFWGDHGWHLGEKEHWRKFALWEEATRAPLIWVAPGVTQPGGVCERTVDFMSIYPTLTDLAGIATPAHVEGKSIRTLLADPSAPWSQPAVTTFGYGNHAARSEGWRYIRYENGDEELYDEASDPYEWTNLADQAEFAERKAALATNFPSGGAPPVEGKQRGRKKARRAERAAAADSE